MSPFSRTRHRLWPFCPLKRYVPRESGGNGMETAYLFAGRGPVLHHGNMFGPKENDRQETFADYRAILDAGWVVD